MARTNPMRVDKEFEKAVEEIQIERIKNGIDKKMQTSARITKAMTRQLDFDKRMKEIINTEFKDE